MTLNDPGSRVEVHNCCNIALDGGKWSVAVPKVALCSACVCCTGWYVLNIRVCVCVWGRHMNRWNIYFFKEWLNSGSYFPTSSKSALGRSVGPIRYHLERLHFDGFPIFWLSWEAASKASCSQCQNAVQEPRCLLFASCSNFSDNGCVSVAFRVV